jgi:hypothetical protein
MPMEGRSSGVPSADGERKRSMKHFPAIIEVEEGRYRPAALVITALQYLDGNVVESVGGVTFGESFKNPDSAWNAAIRLVRGINARVQKVRK